jgi:hypothetical protein
VEQNLLDQSQKSLVFGKSNFYVGEKFGLSFGTCFAEIKSLVIHVSVNSHFLAVNVQILDNIGPKAFISWAISLKHSC